jgi:D-3-phosphoglycerate dehydrogenase / 2-oxoglutarate reductase
VATPIVLLVDPELEPGTFGAALGPEFSCRDRVRPDEAASVVALVTGDVPIGEAEIAGYPSLRAAVTCSVGTDHLDTDALARCGIAVRNTPTYCTEEVSDHALACVLAGWRGLWRLGQSVRAGAWHYAAAGTLRRFDRSRLGIVGLGRIGRSVARKAGSLGIQVVAHDPHLTEADGIPLLELAELLTTSDAVTLHAPGAPGARPLIGAAELALMPPHAVLVNLARPGLVDLDAVLQALEEGRLAGAAWDVWPQEPPAAGDPRLATPGLVVTPHAAWFSAEADRAWLEEAVAALRSTLLT